MNEERKIDTEEVDGVSPPHKARVSDVQETLARKVYAGEVAGRLLSAIQLTTAAGVCAMVDLVLDGTLPAKGLVRQEACPLDAFLANRFGALFLRGTEVAAA